MNTIPQVWLNPNLVQLHHDTPILTLLPMKTSKQTLPTLSYSHVSPFSGSFQLAPYDPSVNQWFSGSCCPLHMSATIRPSEMYYITLVYIRFHLPTYLHPTSKLIYVPLYLWRPSQLSTTPPIFALSEHRIIAEYLQNRLIWTLLAYRKKCHLTH